MIKCLLCGSMVDEGPENVTSESIRYDFKNFTRERLIDYLCAYNRLGLKHLSMCNPSEFLGSPDDDDKDGWDALDWWFDMADGKQRLAVVKGAFKLSQMYQKAIKEIAKEAE